TNSCKHNVVDRVIVVGPDCHRAAKGASLGQRRSVGAPEIQAKKATDGRTAMKVFGSTSVAALAAALLGQAALAQTVESHVAAAKAAAGTEHTVLFNSLCAAATGPAAPVGGPRPVPERSTWHYEPVKVFDNLYYIGEKEYSAW